MLGDDWRVSTLAKSFLLDTHFPMRTITFLDKKMIGSYMIQHALTTPAFMVTMCACSEGLVEGCGLLAAAD